MTKHCPMCEHWEDLWFIVVNTAISHMESELAALKQARTKIRTISKHHKTRKQDAIRADTLLERVENELQDQEECKERWEK